MLCKLNGEMVIGGYEKEKKYEWNQKKDIVSQNKSSSMLESAR